MTGVRELSWREDIGRESTYSGRGCGVDGPASESVSTIEGSEGATEGSSAFDIKLVHMNL